MSKTNDIWYSKFEERYKTIKKSKTGAGWKIEPHVAILKRLIKTGPRQYKTECVDYAAAIAYQVIGKSIEVELFWGSWECKIEYNESFNRTKMSNLMAKGRYLDFTKKHLDMQRKGKTRSRSYTNTDDI